MTLLTARASVCAQDKACIELKTSGRSRAGGRERAGPEGQAPRAGRQGRAGQRSGLDDHRQQRLRQTPTDNVVIANPVPEHMTYVANSAMGTGTDIAYSLDGKEFKARPTLHGARCRRHDARRARRRVPRDPLDVQGRVRAGRDRVRALSRSREVTVEQWPMRVWQGRATAPKFSLPMCVSLFGDLQ